MSDLAHACPACRTITIFTRASPFPRVCGCCEAVLRAASPPVEDEDDMFVLELGPELTLAAPF